MRKALTVGVLMVLLQASNNTKKQDSHVYYQTVVSGGLGGSTMTVTNIGLADDLMLQVTPAVFVSSDNRW